MRGGSVRGALIALAVSIAAVGCSSEDASDQTERATMALIVPSAGSSYFRSVIDGAEEAASASDVVLAVARDSSSVAGQVAAIRSAVESGVDAILISPVGPEVDGAIRSAQEGGLVVVGVGGSGVTSAAADFLVQTDDCVLGIAAGQWTQGRMPAGSVFWPEFGAHFLLVLGDDGEYPRPTCRDSGWFEGAGLPSDVLVQSDSGAMPIGEFSGIPFSIPCIIRFQGDRDLAQRQVTECVRAHPEINAAFASTGSLARTAGEGLRRAGKTVGLDVILSTVSGEDLGLELTRGSWVNAVARPRAAANGGLAVASALTLLRGEMPETQGDKSFLDTGVDVCTNDPQTAVFTAVTRSIEDCLSD